jgi:hypothetical protein
MQKINDAEELLDLSKKAKLLDLNIIKYKETDLAFKDISEWESGGYLERSQCSDNEIAGISEIFFDTFTNVLTLIPEANNIDLIVNSNILFYRNLFENFGNEQDRDWQNLYAAAWFAKTNLVVKNIHSFKDNNMLVKDWPTFKEVAWQVEFIKYLQIQREIRDEAILAY